MALHLHGLLVPLVSGQACAAAEHHGRRSVVEYSPLSRGRQEERETKPVSSSSASALPEPPVIGQCHLYSGQPSLSAAMPHAVVSGLEFTDKLGSVLDSFPSCLSPQTDTKINYQQGQERRLQPSPVT